MLLENISSPEDIKNFSQKEIAQLAQEVRETIIETVNKNGGHMASNLGVVELTIALHRVFNSPKDAIIWDVSHQCYTHKLLTGRYKEFSTLRNKDGISGFTNTAESPHDFFINGHSSTSISSALGLLTARNLSNQDGKVIAVIGDGALTGGMALEGLSHAGQLCKDLIVILNDNQMSIDHNTGAISRYLSRLTATSKYQNFRHFIDRAIDKIPYFGRFLEKLIFRIKRSLKGMFLTNNLFVDLGFEYVGPLDGHNEKALERILRRVKNLHRPVVVHVVTKKGKGYTPAEEDPGSFHGVSPAKKDVQTDSNISFTESFSNIILNAAASNEKIVAITAAMAKGTGLSAFAKEFPQRFFDVGIAEEHATTFAGGLAQGGMIPVTCIYSTFIQRAVDQIIHDISLQNAHSIFILDRAGAVPNDGVTHQGVFDIALFRPVPNIQILSPVSAKDLELCFNWAVEKGTSVVIRIPKINCPKEIADFVTPVEEGKGILVAGTSKSEKKILVVTTGGMYAEVKNAIEAVSDTICCDMYILRFIKPLNESFFIELAKKYEGIVFVEDGVIIGGISQYLTGLLAKEGITNTQILGFEDKYIGHGSRSDVLEMTNLSTENIIKSIKLCCK